MGGFRRWGVDGGTITSSERKGRCVVLSLSGNASSSIQYAAQGQRQAGQIVSLRLFDISPPLAAPYLPGAEGGCWVPYQGALREDDKSPEPGPISSATTSR